MESSPSPSPSPSPSKVELIKQAIKQVMEEASISRQSLSDDHHHDPQLLSKFLSQLEMLEDEDKLQLPETEVNAEEEAEVKSKGLGGEKEEEIVKEIRKVKRQNLITHCLLSVMIVLTIAWQISEVSLIIKLKDGVAHPFRSITNIFTGMLKAPKAIDKAIDNEVENLSSSSLIEHSPLHDFKIPELPHLNTGEEEENK